ncbi:MAG TPA: hypothetical protein VIA10_15095 [Gaiellaceae bacterium]|jgi:hypothetical protein
MTALKNFLVFGICVAATVLLAQTALGATRAAAAKPAARVSTYEPVKHSAKVNSPARVRVQMSALGRLRAAGFSASAAR